MSPVTRAQSHEASQMNEEQIVTFLQAALECSFYLAPTEPGLSYEEIYDVGSRAGLQLSEIRAALPLITNQPIRGRKLLPHSNTLKMWNFYHIHEKPEYRNFEAIDLIFSELRIGAKSDSTGNGALERSLIVERAIVRQIPANDIEAALAILIMCGQITEDHGSLSLASAGDSRPLPGDTHARAMLASRNQPRRNEPRARAYPLVAAVIRLRTAGRPIFVDPLDAFADELAKLGFGAFRLWWKQTVAELRRCDMKLSPVSMSVLAGALIEGALTFVVKHARDQDLAVFAAAKFDADPHEWKIEDLIASAASGKDAAILDPSTRYRVEGLLLTRRRIHAGWMLAEFPDGVPDLRPDDMSDPKATAELVVHRVTAWLQKFPAEPITPEAWAAHAHMAEHFGIELN